MELDRIDGKDTIDEDYEFGYEFGYRGRGRGRGRFSGRGRGRGRDRIDRIDNTETPMQKGPYGKWS